MSLEKPVRWKKYENPNVKEEKEEKDISKKEKLESKIAEPEQKIAVHTSHIVSVVNKDTRYTNSTKPNKYEVTTAANVRKKPDSSSELVTTLSKGHIVTVKKGSSVTVDGWTQLENPEGYILGSVLTSITNM